MEAVVITVFVMSFTVALVCAVFESYLAFAFFACVALFALRQLVIDEGWS